MSILGTPSLRSCLLFCLVAASPAALADRIRIHGPQTALSSGSSFTFRATREEAAPVERKGPPRAGAGRWLWKVLAEGDPGLMIEDTGEYFAPRVTAERLVQVLVFDRDDDRIQESLTVLIAPAGKAAPAGDRGDSKGAGHGGAGAGGSLVLQRAEGASVPGLHGGIPLPTGPAPARKGAAPADPRAWADTTLLAGYGVPFQVPLPPLPAPGWNLRFLVQAGDRWQPLDATSGLKPIVLRGRVGRCRLEAASPGLGLLSSQEVRRQELTVDLRGMTLLAGTPADRGHRDGVGQEARFEEVFGLATVRTRTGTSCLVADSRTHVVRRIDPGGQVATLWGKPYAHGHREGRDSEARFCHPTYLLAPSAPLPGKRGAPGGGRRYRQPCAQADPRRRRGGTPGRAAGAERPCG